MPDAANFFPKEKTAWTGVTVRKEIEFHSKQGAHEYLNLNKDIKTILVLGGSSGAEKINEAIIDSLPELLKKYQVIHQVGKNNLENAKRSSQVTLSTEDNQDRYKMFGYLDDLALRMSAGAADLIITRAGATALTEIARWQIPSIIIPITNSNNNHQRKNAFYYARLGAGSVIEENNLKPEIITAEVERILTNPELQNRMKESTKKAFKEDAGRVIADEIIELGLKHK